jgi:hypothetical protein
MFTRNQNKILADKTILLMFPFFMVLVQKLQDNCKESLNLGHIDIITLKKERDQYEKEKFIQVEALSV